MDLDEKVPNTIDEKVKKAKIGVGQKAPFFSYILKNLTLEKKDKDEIPTAAVNDKGVIMWNEEFMEVLDRKERQGIILHEMLHVALKWFDRRDGRNPELWNVAHDIKVNEMVMKEGLKIPEMDELVEREGGEMFGREDMTKDEAVNLVPDERNNYNSIYVDEFDVTIENLEEKSAEEIYDILDGAWDGKEIVTVGIDMHIETDEDGGESVVTGRGDTEGVDVEGDGDADGLSEEELEDIISKAQTLSKKRGTESSAIEQIVEKDDENHINWQSVLKKFVSRKIPQDQNWMKRNKNFISHGTYMPGVERDGLDIVVAIDTSGSISDEDIQFFLSEIHSMFKAKKHIDVTVIQHDAEVNGELELSRAVEVEEFEVKGRGGTDHVPVFDKVEEDHKNKRVLVNFTDGYTRVPEKTEVRNVIWVLNNFNADAEPLEELGRVLRVNLDDYD